MMGRTYADLLAKITADIVRPIDSDVVEDYCEQVIEDLQREFFYASPILDLSLNTIVNQSLYRIPSNFVEIERIRYLVNDVWRDASDDRGRPVDHDDILDLDTESPSITGEPLMWAPYGRMFRIYPAADAIYPLELSGTGKIPIPSATTETNFWTDDARTLVRHETVARIWDGKLRDPEKAAAALRLAGKAREGLVSETVSKETTGRLRLNW